MGVRQTRIPLDKMLEYRKILCAYDFDERSLSALLLANALARESNATLYILHIARVPRQDMDVPLPFDADPRWEKEARAKLEIIATRNLSAEVHYEIAVRTGLPDIDIVRAAEALGVDLIVMATHGRSGLGHFIMGSVVEHVIREAACPVLVIRPSIQASASRSRSPDVKE